jgi:hypothetical protein
MKSADRRVLILRSQLYRSLHSFIVPRHVKSFTHWHMTFYTILILTQPTVTTRRNTNLAIYIQAQY